MRELLSSSSAVVTKEEEIYSPQNHLLKCNQHPHSYYQNEAREKGVRKGNEGRRKGERREKEGRRKGVDQTDEDDERRSFTFSFTFACKS